MEVKTTSEELCGGFESALISLWGEDLGKAITPRRQKALFRKKFGAKVSGGHFDSGSDEGLWNTSNVAVTFRSKKSYFLFILEWC